MSDTLPEKLPEGRERILKCLHELNLDSGQLIPIDVLYRAYARLFGVKFDREECFKYFETRDRALAVQRFFPRWIFYAVKFENNVVTQMVLTRQEFRKLEDFSDEEPTMANVPAKTRTSPSMTVKKQPLTFLDKFYLQNTAFRSKPTNILYPFPVQSNTECNSSPSKSKMTSDVLHSSQSRGSFRLNQPQVPQMNDDPFRPIVSSTTRSSPAKNYSNPKNLFKSNSTNDEFRLNQKTNSRRLNQVNDDSRETVQKTSRFEAIDDPFRLPVPNNVESTSIDNNTDVSSDPFKAKTPNDVFHSIPTKDNLWSNQPQTTCSSKTNNDPFCPITTAIKSSPDKNLSKITNDEFRPNQRSHVCRSNQNDDNSKEITKKTSHFEITDDLFRSNANTTARSRLVENDFYPPKNSLKSNSGTKQINDNSIKNNLSSSISSKMIRNNSQANSGSNMSKNLPQSDGAPEGRKSSFIPPARPTQKPLIRRDPPKSLMELTGLPSGPARGRNLTRSKSVSSCRSGDESPDSGIVSPKPRTSRDHILDPYRLITVKDNSSDECAPKGYDDRTRGERVNAALLKRSNSVDGKKRMYTLGSKDNGEVYSDDSDL